MKSATTALLFSVISLGNLIASVWLAIKGNYDKATYFLLLSIILYYLAGKEDEK